MKVKVAILEKDEVHQKRLASAFETKYADRAEVYCFSDESVALSNLGSLHAHLLLAEECFEIDPSALPERCTLAYLTESAEGGSLRDFPAIFKYQHVDQIFRQVLSLCANIAGGSTGIGGASGGAKVLLFASPCGGCGTSTVAAGCALHFALAGKRVLYLDLESFGCVDIFFRAQDEANRPQGQTGPDLSDIIYTLKSKKASLSLKLESCVKRDASDVCFYSAAKNAPDMLELRTEEKLRLLTELSGCGSYDLLVVDCDFSIGEEGRTLLHAADSVIWVSDGSAAANHKTARAYEALCNLEEGASAPLPERVRLIYNRFGNSGGAMLPAESGPRVLGGLNRFRAGERAIADQIATMPLFNGLLS